MRVPCLIVLLVLMAQAQEPPPTAPGKPAPAESPAPNQAQRTAINLLGQTDAGAGESRRNENVQFNLIDTATAKELMVRLGTSATIHSEFQSDRSYFGGEFGARPAATLHVPVSGGRGWHGAVSFGHLNSFLSARTFFQPTSVKPARENEFGVNLAGPLWRGARVSIDLSTQAIRGNVNGNVIVPLLAERTPLAVEPRLRAIVQRYLDAYPLPDPRRPDQRAVNVNAEQRIDTYNAGGRLDQTLSPRDALHFRYQFTGQQVEAFQFVKGQNPDTSTRNHVSRITWTRAQSAATMIDTTLGFDRLGSLLQPDQEWPDANVGFNNAISSIGPSPIIPIDRAQNSFRTGLQFRQSRGNHQWSAGAEITRLQVNGLEQDGNRGIITFTNDFGRDFVTNLRLGTPSQYVRALGSTHRGYRQWLPVAFLHDRWKLNAATDLTLGLRFEPVPTPSEVNRLDRLPYRCDCNNLAPRLGVARRLPSNWGVLRAAYGLHYGTVFATTYGQTRLNPPSYRLVINQPDLVDPLRSIDLANLSALRSGRFIISPNLVAPYSHQYNFSWEPRFTGAWKLQLGYVGSRGVKLFQMWFDNRARPVEGIPQTSATINLRRPDPSVLEVFRIHNSSRATFNAARASLILPRWHGLTGDVAYWFSKSIDLGNDYTATMGGADARLGRSQGEDFVHQDLKGLSSFDQPHAFLSRLSWQAPRAAGRFLRDWSWQGVVLVKNGTPFSVESGGDAPGVGNVDGQGGDRVHLVNPAVLGRTISHPDRSNELLPAEAFRFMLPTDARGNLGRNTFRRARIGNVNASLNRAFVLRGEARLLFRAESINFFNTPQFAEPTKELLAPTFGRITNTLNDGRTFRFTARFEF